MLQQRGGLDEDVVRGHHTASARTPSLKAAIARAGLSPREFNAAFDAYIIAQDQLMGEEMATTEDEKRRYAAPPAGIRRDNVELMRRMEKEGPLWSIV